MLKLIAMLALVVLALVAFGGAVAAIAGTPPPRGRMVDVGGRALRVVCEGPQGAGPMILLEAGAFGFAADWAAVQAKLAAQRVHSCAYDRAGLGFSDPGPAPRDGVAVTNDLAALLDAAGETGPFVYVGHSMAGLYAPLVAARLPGRMVGAVLADAATPQAMDDATVAGFVKQFARISRSASALAGMGLLKPFAPWFGDLIGLPKPAAREKRWAFGRGAHNRVAADEVGQWPAAARQGAAVPPLDPALPVAVVLAGADRGDAWNAARTAPARASRAGSVDFVPGAGHASLLGERYADAIVAAVLRVRGAAAS